MWNSHCDWSTLHAHKNGFMCKYRSRRGGVDKLTLTHNRATNPDLFVVARGEDLTLTHPRPMEILGEKLRSHHHHYLSQHQLTSNCTTDSTDLSSACSVHLPSWGWCQGMKFQLHYDAEDIGTGPLGCVVRPALGLLAFIHAEPFTWLLTFHLALSCHFLGFTNFSLSLDLWTATFHLTSDLRNSGSSYV